MTQGERTMKRYVMVLVLALSLLGGVVTQSGAVYAQDCLPGLPVPGGGGPDVLTGGPRNNLIQGFEDNDQLFGGGCNDHLYGGPGNDYLDGGAGVDVCTGGPGVDFFVNCEVVVP
jgi:hypothetical protein